MTYRDHARLAPSSMGRTVACPGSVQMQERYPETEHSEEAIEGTRAHELLGSMFTHAQLAFDPTDEMKEGAQLAFDYIMGMTRGILPLFIEQRVSMAGIHPDNWGTPDIWTWSGGDLHQFEYKYGHGFVDAFENWQCLNYTVGILATASPGVVTSKTRIHIHVIQPRNYDRAGPIRTWTITVEQLQAYIARITEACAEATGDNPRLIPGQHCKNCTARVGCEALHKNVMWDTAIIYGVRPMEMSAHDVGLDLALLKRIKERVDALFDARSEQASRMLRLGQNVPHWMMEQGTGRENWTIPDAQVFAAGDLVGLNLRQKPKAITPTQARKAGFTMADYFAKRDNTTSLSYVSTNYARRIFQPKE